MPDGSPTEAPLVGVVVLDLGQAAVAPVAAAHLGMLGATVIKVESPRGDMVRVGEPNMRGTSTTFIGNNWTKYGIWLDLKEQAGREQLGDLIGRADLLIENFRSPQVLARLGFDYRTSMSALNPKLVYVESSAFGDGGPLGDMVSNEWITEALGGLVATTGAPGQPEFMRGTALLDWSGAMVNTVACLAALHQREHTGRGLAVRTSQLGSTVFAGLTRVVEQLATGTRPAPLGSAGRSFAPDGAFATGDGYLSLSAPTEQTWRALCAALGLEELLDQPGLADNAGRVAHREQLTTAIEQRLTARPSEHWLSILAGTDVPHRAFPVARWLSDELAGDPQVIAQRLLVALPTPWGLVRTHAPHWRFDRTPAAITRPSPTFGQDNDTVTGLLHHRAPASPNAAQESFVEDDAAGLRPLAGIRVLEVATGLCGPLAARMLGELGADVVKIEPPGGDWLADAAPEGEPTDALYRELNAGKDIVRLDLNSPAGQIELRSRLDGCDVLLVGYRPRQLQALGLSDTDVADAAPGALFCQITGWGATGPDADRPATELDVQAAVGMYRHLGSAAAPPVRVGYDLVSVNTALAAVQAVLAGLWERRRSGQGQKVEVSMLATAIAISQWGITAESRPDRLRGLQLEGYTLPPDLGVRCGDGRGCRLDFRKDYRNWYRLFDQVGLASLRDDPRFATEDALALHRNELGDLLTDQLTGWTFDDLDDFVRGIGGTVVPVLAVDELLAHPQTSVLGVVRPDQATSVRLPYLASYWQTASDDRGGAHVH